MSKDLNCQEEQTTGPAVDMDVNLKMVSGIIIKTLMKMVRRVSKSQQS